MLARAHWAASAFAGYDHDTVLRIAETVARAAHAESARYADWAVKETGFGVVEHKILKNQACSLGLLERYRNEDFVSPRIDPAAKIVSIPRPAGVILALTPSTNPVCSVFFKVILALLTRNAIVVSPHPMARACCADAARLLAEVAESAGAPDGAVQVVEHPTVALDEGGRDRLRAYLFPDGLLNGDAIGKDAAWIADQAGIRVPPRTRLLLAPVDLVVPEEPFCREKLSPVLGVVGAPTAERGIEAARAVVRIGGAGHSAAIHSQDPQVITRYGVRVPVLRIAVNAPNSTGSAGIDTNLALSMTLGTGFAGRSSIGENLEPRHLVNWTRLAYNSDPGVTFADFGGVEPWHRPPARVPAYPRASNLPPESPGAPGVPGVPAAAPSAAGQGGAPAARDGTPGAGSAGGSLPDSVRDQLRVMIIEELAQLMGG